MHLKHLAYYMLLWIAYIDDQYGIYKRPKEQNSSYLKRTDQKYNNKRYINAKFIYRQYPIKAKREGMLTLKLGRFINKKYLKGRLQWEYINNKYLQHIQEKINTKYQPKENNSQAGKGEGYRTKGSQQQSLRPLRELQVNT